VSLVWLPFEESGAGLGPLPSGLQVQCWDGAGPWPGSVADVELFVLPYMIGPRAFEPIRQMTRLRVLQTLTAGYEDVLAVRPPGVALCNAPGVHDASTAELAVTLALASVRGVADFVRAAGEHRWAPVDRTALADLTVLVVGFGGVGRAVARRLAGFEVAVVPVASRARVGPDGPVRGVDELAALLPAADVVVLCVPLTDATRALVDARFLARMKDGALLVNVSRGPVVVTSALVAELQAGRLTAALDVTDPEPLPADHPLWDCPGLLVSPHVGGNTSAFMPRAQAFLADQLRRFAAGEPLLGLVGG
jgi:phosphoglycerate dehydrogenase-like enzyme